MKRTGAYGMRNNKQYSIQKTAESYAIFPGAQEEVTSKKTGQHLADPNGDVRTRITSTDLRRSS